MCNLQYLGRVNVYIFVLKTNVKRLSSFLRNLGLRRAASRTELEIGVT